MTVKAGLHRPATQPPKLDACCREGADSSTSFICCETLACWSAPTRQDDLATNAGYRLVGFHSMLLVRLAFRSHSGGSVDIGRERVVNRFKLDLHYRNRFVAFIDILGFTEKIQKIETDSSVFSELLRLQKTYNQDLRNASALPVVGKLISRSIANFYAGRKTQPFNERAFSLPRHLFPHGYSWNKQTNIRSTTFSDSIVISTDPTMSGGHNLISLTIGLCRQLLLKRTLARGGIAFGPLHHGEDVVFGKALIEAYHLERDLSKNPRVILSPGINKTPLASDRTGEIGDDFDPAIKQDVDGMYYADIFFADHASRMRSRHADGTPITPPFFVSVRAVLSKLLRQETDARNWAKVVWLTQKYNATVTRYSRWEIEPLPIPQGPLPPGEVRRRGAQGRGVKKGR